MVKDAAKKKKERQDDIEAKKRVKAKIEADKEARRQKAEMEKAKRAGQTPVSYQASEPGPPAASSSSKPASSYTETRMRFQTPKGNIMKTFPATTTLFEVASALNQENGIELQVFVQNFPKKIFNSEFFGDNLKELGLVPSATLIVQ